jgi:hypothetical protein
VVTKIVNLEKIQENIITIDKEAAHHHHLIQTPPAKRS